MINSKKIPFLQLSAQFKPQKVYPEIPEDVSRKYGVVPLWTDKEYYAIATADTNFSSVDKIEQLVRKPIKTYLLTYPQIQSIQHQLFGSQSTVLPILDQAEIQEILSGETEKTDQSIKKQRDIEDDYSKSNNLVFIEKMRLEMLGIQNRLPHLDLNMVIINKSLAPLVPFEIAEKYQIIPLWWIGNRLFIGCNISALADNIVYLNRLFPFDVQPILCDEKQWRSAFRAIYLEDEKTPAITEKDIIRILQNHFSLDLNDLQRANIYSGQYQTDLVTALLDLHIISTEKLLGAKSSLTGIDILGTEKKPKKEWAEILPIGIARQLGVIAFDGDENSIYVAGSEFSKVYIELLQSLTHLKVRAFLINKQKEQEWLEQFYPQDDLKDGTYKIVSLVEILLSIGLISKEQLQEATGDESYSDQRLSECLISKGFLDDDDLAMSLSLQTGLPFVLLEHANLNQELLNEFSRELAEKYELIPLFRKENVVWAATSDPFNGKGIHVLGDILKTQVVPIIVPKKVLHAIIDQSWSIPQNRAMDEAQQYIQKLIHSDFLTQTQANQMIQLMITEALPFDEAFVKASLYDIHQANQILSNIFSVPSFDIALIEEQRYQFDGLGNRISQTIYTDQVKPAVAGLIDIETANQYCILPIRKEGQQVVVAFADPLQIHNLDVFENRFTAPIQPVLVIRADLKDAIARTLGHKNIGTYLLENSYITRRQLNEALELSNKTGVRLGQALLIKQFIQEKQIYKLLAQQAGMDYVDLEKIEIQEKIARLIDPEIERELGILPIKATDTDLTLAIVDPIDQKGIAKAKELTGRIIHPVVASEDSLEKALEQLYAVDYTTISISNLLKRSPKESAYKVLSTGQAVFFSALLLLSIAYMFLNFTSFVITVNVLITIFYVGFSAYKFYLIYNAMNHDCEVPVSQTEIEALDPKILPIYTLLVPVYKETEVLPDLMKSLTRLDYPSTKLDIKILFEADDVETINSFYEMKLPPHFRATIVPGSLPKTKPKACNYGLIHARGEYIVIFDAEDRPDSDQLKKAVVAFQKSSPDVVCIQAKLNYYNRSQNLLTQWFTSEYSMWFDLFLPGLDASEAPIPLGGTSNHFKRRALVEVGAWDPHNVTEDADLGMRLYKRGFHTRTIDSTTYEEANSRLNNWLRQRSRWIKGYIQTWLVHMRNPAKLLKEVGLKGFISFQFVIGGTFFSALINPILWTITTIWFLTKWAFIQETFPGMIFYLSSISLYLGNFVFTYMNVAGAMRRKHYDNVRYALLSPVYWGLMSIGAWRGFLQLISKPHYWEKTMHGFGLGFEVETEKELESQEDDNYTNGN
ncbi:MAG: glycosyltransferase family 2 protein [Anaerolineaceae bacterium]